MFNVCPACGEYSEDKQVPVGVDVPVRPRPTQVAVCTGCGHKHEFLSLPLYVVTGASATGKSTLLLHLASSASSNGEFVYLDSDILWRDEFNKPDNDYYDYRNIWLRMVKNIAQNGRPVVLFGSVTPGQFERCTERRYIGAIRYLALVCDEDELVRRLKARPGWRKSGTDETLGRMREYNDWLKQNAHTHGMDTLDTTSLSVNDTAAKTLAWLRSWERN